MIIIAPNVDTMKNEKLIIINCYLVPDAHVEKVNDVYSFLLAIHL